MKKRKTLISQNKQAEEKVKELTAALNEKDKALNRLHIYSRRGQHSAKHSISSGNLSMDDEDNFIDNKLNNLDKNSNISEDNIHVIKETMSNVQKNPETSSQMFESSDMVSKCDINMNGNDTIPNSEKENFDKIATTLFESEESAEYTEPEYSDSSSADDTKDSSVETTESLTKPGHITENKSFQSNRNFFEELGQTNMNLVATRSINIIKEETPRSTSTMSPIEKVSLWLPATQPKPPPSINDKQKATLLAQLNKIDDEPSPVLSSIPTAAERKSLVNNSVLETSQQDFSCFSEDTKQKQKNKSNE